LATFRHDGKQMMTWSRPPVWALVGAVAGPAAGLMVKIGCQYPMLIRHVLMNSGCTTFVRRAALFTISIPLPKFEAGRIVADADLSAQHSPPATPAG
jgi:hypothetical protein